MTSQEREVKHCECSTPQKTPLGNHVNPRGIEDYHTNACNLKGGVNKWKATENLKTILRRQC